MALSLLAFAASVASAGPCHAAVMDRVFKDDARAEPFVLVTTGAERYRLGGQDFIQPRDWRRGEQLQICAEAGPGGWVSIRNIHRSERMLGQAVGTGEQARTGRP